MKRSGKDPRTQTTGCEGLGWGRGWVEGGKGGEMGDICNSVNNKNKVKKLNKKKLNERNG